MRRRGMAPKVAAAKRATGTGTVDICDGGGGGGTIGRLMVARPVDGRGGAERWGLFFLVIDTKTSISISCKLNPNGWYSLT